MSVPKSLVAVLAVLACAVSAAPTATASNPVGKTTFTIGNTNITQGAGCTMWVETEHGSGCSDVVVLDGATNCDKINTAKSGLVCNGTASVDFSKSPAAATFVTWEYLANCDIKGNGCTAMY
ncbi:hypothetical protein BGW36DRAFT_404512 [Talaromyces proteolyticus]|uniref:Uncharacterized protein n=1 Tax=Talaromyces proteolyticus TaxID=1131652 RepID=A0AAD4KW90_9EURO|nr:uncharacterized protein BGW36DRAFT_404512 [Talaromyces proteolyticus]KAH8701544.1 hypothetical protein BGW36DRAFT_404512 [Talaromyces proteolyticus]